MDHGLWILIPLKEVVLCFHGAPFRPKVQCDSHRMLRCKVIVDAGANKDYAKILRDLRLSLAGNVVDI